MVVIKALALPLDKRILMMRVFFLSAWYRFLILFVPFRRLAEKIGKLQYETTDSVTEQDKKLSIMLADMVKRVCRHTPWKSLCLVQALTAQHLFWKHGLSCTLYLGIAKKSDGEMEAHAWLRCGDIILTGGEVRERFSQIACFGKDAV